MPTALPPDSPSGSPPEADPAPAANWRLRLLLVAAIAATIGLTVGLMRGPTDGLVVAVATALAGASFFVLFQPPTESSGRQGSGASVDFGRSGAGEPEAERVLNRAQRRAAAKAARREAGRAPKDA